MLYLYWNLIFFLKNFLDYEKIDVIIQILKRYKLNPHRQNVAVSFFVPKSIYEWPLISSFSLYKNYIFLKKGNIFSVSEIFLV